MPRPSLPGTDAQRAHSWTPAFVDQDRWDDPHTLPGVGKKKPPPVSDAGGGEERSASPVCLLSSCQLLNRAQTPFSRASWSQVSTRLVPV